VCSWKGHKENHAVGESVIIESIKEFVCDPETGAATEAEFKTIAMNFFRFGRQRFERELLKDV